MNLIWQILKEHISHLNLIFRLSIYELKAKYKMHYLGAFWQVLNPFIQVGVYWFVFGMGIRGGSPVGEFPFFVWLLTGLVPWLFIAPTVNQASNSIHSKIMLVSKMNFPVSVLPTIKVVENGITFLIMVVIAQIIVVINGIMPSIYLLQLPYYLLCLFMLMLGLTLLLSTLTTIIRDIQNIVQSIIRVMMFLLPVVWNVDTLPDYAVTILKMNPFFYTIEGFRNSMLGGEWFFQDPWYTLYFWCMTFLLLLIGSAVHLKFRHKFVDYL
ncbi:MAG: ABC transporter permease [Bacillus sp. (in: firmicutes)]